MLDAIIRLSLRYRSLVMVLSLAALIYGAYSTTTLPIDVFPDLDRPRVVILTECPGLSPEEIESLITSPIETSVLGATGVQSVRSQSSMGLVVIYVEFNWDTEIRAARQVVQERLATVLPLMPEGIRPLMAPPTSIMGQIMHIGVHLRRGPKGGDLAEVIGTGFMAERTKTAQGLTLSVWKPTDRFQPQTWESIPVDQFTWDPTAYAGTGGQAADKQKPVDTAATPSTRPGDEQRASVTLNGKKHLVVYPSVARQLMDLRTTADWIIRPRLLKVSGVAEILVIGGDRKQYQVLADPPKLVEFGVSLQEVEQALIENNENSSGGFTIEGQQERPIRVIGRLGPAPEKVLEDLRKVPVKVTADRTVLLEHVAAVIEGPQPKRGDASIDGGPGVVITLVKQPHVDTRGLTDLVHAALIDVEQTLPANVAIARDLFQFKSFIDRGIYYVGESLVIGAVLVIIILALFLMNFRTTVITLTAIPLSLALTTLAFKLIGFLSGSELSINVMTLGGIAVAMGELVDDAIVDVENIFRRLRENNALATPRPALTVVYEASREIRSAIVFGTMVVILVFLPLFAMSGVEGRLFIPLGVAYIVSIVSSLVVSLTVTPVLSYYLLPNSRATHHSGDGLLLRTLKWMASFLIRLSLAHAGLLLVITWTLVGVCVFLLTHIGADFLPQFDEGSIQVNVSLPAGASLQASNDAAVISDKLFAKRHVTPDNPQGEIIHFVRRTGRAALDEHAEPVSRGEYILTMNPHNARNREVVLKEVLKELQDELPGVDIEAEQPLAHLISHMLSGVTAQIAIKVYGDDLDVLQRIAHQIKAEITGVSGVTQPVIEAQLHVDELHVVLRPDALARYGVSRHYVAEFVRMALQGEVQSEVLEGQRRFDLILKLSEEFRTDYTNLAQLRIDLPAGRGQILLGDVADFPEGASGPNQVMRENVRRRIVVRCNTLGRDLSSVVADIQKQVNHGVALPQGYFIEYGGQFESQRSATFLITVLGLISLVGMFVVLMILHPSLRIVFQILNAIPTAFIGGVMALVITHQTLTVASLVGFVSLGGIAVRNGILLVTHYFHLMQAEGEQFSPEMVLRGSLERLSPVLMTALTAGMGLVPIVLGGHKPGLEILYPVATVILGGLITSTFCEFLIHPGLFWKFSGKDALRLTQANESEHELLG